MLIQNMCVCVGGRVDCRPKGVYRQQTNIHTYTQHTHSASEVTTVWRYRNSIIIIIINLKFISTGIHMSGLGGGLRSPSACISVFVIVFVTLKHTSRQREEGDVAVQMKTNKTRCLFVCERTTGCLSQRQSTSSAKTHKSRSVRNESFERTIHLQCDPSAPLSTV